LRLKTINIQEANLGEETIVSDMRFVEEVYAQGHPNVLGTHKMTFEVTRVHDLSERGNCVIGVAADKGPSDLSFEFKEACKREDAKITVTLEALGITDIIHGSGSRDLTFAHDSEMVGRKSSYASDRTIMIRADKAASDLDRQLIEALKSNKTTLTFRILVEA
jgi:hypothetical protein